MTRSSSTACLANAPTRRGRLRGDARGAVAVEYVILAGCIALTTIVGFRAFGGEVGAKVFCQAQGVAALSNTDCSATDQNAAELLSGVDVAPASVETSTSADDGCSPGWRGALCRLAHSAGDKVRDVVGDLPGGTFVADYATAAWSLPDAMLQSALPLFGAAGEGAPGVIESWTATGKQLLALGCFSIPGGCGTLDSGLVPGFEQGEATRLQIEAGKSFVGWQHWADGEYGTAAGTLLPNIALTLVPGPKAAGLGRATRVATTHDAPDAPCVGASCPAGSGVCFTAGTLVHAATGLVPIERIKKGDFVWSREEGSGALGLRRVARTFVNTDKPIVEVALGAASGESEALKATPEHPFWTRERGWVAAKDLRAGENVLQRAGGFSRVLRSTPVRESADVFNFEVEEFHTYFVGAHGAWVHNECQTPAETAAIRIPDNVVAPRSIDTMASMEDMFRMSAAQRNAEITKIEGLYGNQGMSLRDASIELEDNGSLQFQATVFDGDTYAGGIVQSFGRDSEGKLFVYGDLAHLEPRSQGKGFSSNFSPAIGSWYVRSGAEYMEVFAALSHGGYTWAKAGFTWHPEKNAKKRDSIQNAILDVGARVDMPEADSARLLAMATRFDGPVSTWPQPRELATFTDSNGRSWGKEIMMGKSWHAIMYLVEPTP